MVETHTNAPIEKVEPLAGTVHALYKDQTMNKVRDMLLTDMKAEELTIQKIDATFSLEPGAANHVMTIKSITLPAEVPQNGEASTQPIVIALNQPIEFPPHFAHLVPLFSRNPEKLLHCVTMKKLTKTVPAANENQQPKEIVSYRMEIVDFEETMGFAAQIPVKETAQLELDLKEKEAKEMTLHKKEEPAVAA